MIMFRKFDELDYLNREYDRLGFSFTVIYERRRVGKTELINNFIKDKPGIYFMVDKRGTHANLIRFRTKSTYFFAEFEPAVEGFDRIFEYIKKVDKQ